MGYMQDSRETKGLINSIITELYYDKELRKKFREILDDAECHKDNRFDDNRDWSHYMIRPNGW